MFALFGLLVALASVPSFAKTCDLSEIAPSDTRPALERLKAFGHDCMKELEPVVTGSEPLHEKRAAIWAMIYQDDKGKASELLRNLLSHDYKGQFLESEDESTMVDAVRALGFVAHQDGQAAGFLMARLHPSEWKTTKTWTCDKDRDDYELDYLTAMSIQALGTSAEPVAVRKLGTLKGRSAGYLHRFAADIAQAEFYIYIREQRGFEGILKSGPDQYLEWAQDQGHKTVTWVDEKMRGPRPPL